MQRIKFTGTGDGGGGGGGGGRRRGSMSLKKNPFDLPQRGLASTSQQATWTKSAH